MAGLRVLLLAVLLAGLATPAAAQEGTTGPGGDDPLTRYDSPSTAQLAEQTEQNRKSASEIEAEIAELEEDFDFGPRRDALREELYSLPDPTQTDNRLGNARLSDIESAPLPAEAGPKAKELRRKAASLDALQAWAETSNINIDSRLYGLLSEGEAARLAATYRREAGALEVAAATEDVAQEKKEAAEAAVPEPEPKEREGEGAAEREVEPRVGGSGAGRADDAPPAPPETDYGEGGGLNPGTLALLVLMALGAGAYGLSLLSRRPVGRKLSGAWRARFGAMMASSGNSAEKPPEPPREEPQPGPPGEAPDVPTERPGAATAPAQRPREPEGRAEPPGAATGRVTPEERPAARPSTTMETGSPDAAALQEWFEAEAPVEATPQEAPEAPREAREEAPVDVNRMVAEKIARMRRSGELGPDDQVAVTVVDGKLVVRKRG